MTSDTLDGKPAHPAIAGLRTAARNGRLSRREFLALASALGLTTAAAYAALGTAWAPAARAQTPRRGGTLRMSMPVMPIGDPRLFDWSEMGNLARPFLETLVRYTAASTFEPWLLESWSASADASEYVLSLRRGVTWSTGEPLTAEHAVFNIARWCERHVPGNSMAARVAGLIAETGTETLLVAPPDDDGTVVPVRQQRTLYGLRDGAVEILDDHTLRLRLAAPDITLIPGLSEYPALIVHPDFAGPGASLADAPIGTGPWTLTDFEVGKRAAYVRREDAGGWWGDAVFGPVHLDGIEYRDLGTLPGAELRAFADGEIDANHETAVGSVDEFDDLGLERSEVVTSATICVRMNVAQPPFGDVRLRRAVQAAVDNAVILDLGYRGLGLPAADYHVGPMHPDHADVGPQRFDPALAAALLAGPDYAATTLDLVSIDDDWRRETCDAVAAQLRDAGFDVTRTVLPPEAFWADWMRYPFSGTNWNMRPLGVQIYALGYRSGAAWNESGFSDARFDALLDDALALPDPDARRPLMAEMQTILRDSGVLVQPFWRTLVRHTTSRVHDLAMHPSLEHHLEVTWLSD